MSALFLDVCVSSAVGPVVTMVVTSDTFATDEGNIEERNICTEVAVLDAVESDI